MLELIFSDFFIQGIGFVGMFVLLYVFQCKSYNKMIFWKITGEIIFAVQYFLLGAYSGMATNLASVVTNLLYRQRIKKEKPTLVLQIIFSFVFFFIGMATWHGWASVLVIAAKVLSTISCGTRDLKILRLLNLIIMPLWLIYDVMAGSWGGVVGDILNLGSLVLGIIRFDVKNT